MRRKGLMRDGSFVMHETEQSEIVPRVDGTALTRFSRFPGDRRDAPVRKHDTAEATPFVPRLTHLPLPLRFEQFVCTARQV